MKRKKDERKRWKRIKKGREEGRRTLRKGEEEKTEKEVREKQMEMD